MFTVYIESKNKLCNKKDVLSQSNVWNFMNNCINQVTLVGYAGQDAEIKQAAQNQGLRFSLATTENRKDKITGEYIPTTEWHNIICWNQKLVSKYAENIKKGTHVLVQGKLHYGTYKAKDGTEKTKAEIMVNDWDCKLVVLNHSLKSNIQKDEFDF
jgi:single-strand DNA-binding protein